jgi:hypothetical protein
MALGRRHLHDLAPSRWPNSWIAAQCKAIQPPEERVEDGLKQDQVAMTPTLQGRALISWPMHVLEFEARGEMVHEGGGV